MGRLRAVVDTTLRGGLIGAARAHVVVAVVALRPSKGIWRAQSSIIRVLELLVEAADELFSSSALGRSRFTLLRSAVELATGVELLHRPVVALNSLASEIASSRAKQDLLSIQILVLEHVDLHLALLQELFGIALGRGFIG